MSNQYNELKKQAEELKRNGWVGRSKFAELIGRADGGHIPGIARKYGVRTIIVNADKRGGTWLFWEADASMVPIKRPRKKDESFPTIPVYKESDLKHCVSLQPADLEKIDGITNFMQSRGQLICFSKAVQLAIRVAVINSGLLDALNEIIAADGRSYRQGELL